MFTQRRFGTVIVLSCRALKKLREGMRGLRYATYEARVEAKASGESRAGIGGRRVIVITNGRRIGGDWWAGNGYAHNAEQSRGSRDHSR